MSVSTTALLEMLSSGDLRPELDALEMDWAEPYLDAWGSPYFSLGAGVEHYRLLMWLSRRYAGKLVLDVGTFHGGSAVALSWCSETRVVSFDLVNHRTRPIERPNLEFRVEDVLARADLLCEASLILLDTFHDGPFEHQFYERLEALGYRGLLLLDDIYLNDAMQEFWHSIRRPKQDLTHLGHWSGTGIVHFGEGR